MLKLLVADDDPAIAEALSIYGERRGYDVYKAGRGDEAVEVAQREEPDVILLDIMMPGMDGRDVLKALKEGGMSDRTIVIFVTARDTQSDRIVGLELGAVDYETKPLHLGRLFDKIKRLIDKREAGEI